MRCSRLLRSAPSTASSISSLLSSSSSSSSTSPVIVHGWIRSLRSQKHLSFLDLNDGSSHLGLQAVIPRQVLEESCDETTRQKLQTGASVALTGRLGRKQGGNREGMEMRVEGIRLVGECDGKTYPIQKKDHSLPFLRRNAHLRARTSTISSMLRLRDCMTRACYTYFYEQGYLNASMPVSTSSDCEGAGEVFTITYRPAGSTSILASPKGKEREVDPPSGQQQQQEEKDSPSSFFDRPTYLSVSGQLHLEAIAIGGGLSKAWHLGPAFRAERSDTNRHLNEFWMCEAELGWTKELEDVLSCAEGLVKAIVGALAREKEGEMREVFPKGWEVVQGLLERQEQPWKRITYHQAVRELQEAAEQDERLFQHKPSYDAGLKSEHERWLAEKYGPTFVTDYPTTQKPFYMRLNPSPPTTSSSAQPEGPTVACFDLLVPRIGELAGGSMREERLSHLVQAMQDKGMQTEEYEWYLDLRRYGSVPHGGFGLGWERLVSYLLGIENVRECIPFPRGSEGSRF